jgi:hypothetical protein
MAKLTIHLQAAEGTDPKALAGDVQQELEKLPDVHTAETRTEQYRSIGPTEIIAGLTLAVGILETSAKATEALAKLLDGIQAVVKSAKGLHAAFVEVGMKKVALDQLTPEDLQKLAAHAVAQ